jgi:hypothetical protein
MRSRSSGQTQTGEQLLAARGEWVAPSQDGQAIFAAFEEPSRGSASGAE